MSEETNEASYEVLQDDGIFILSGDIDASSSTAVIRWVLESNIKKEHKQLTMIVNSAGGEISDGFAIIDIMSSSRIPINTVGLGQICSCGFLIFINGKNRILTPNTSIMSHPYSWGVSGQHHELIATRKEQDMTQQRMLDHITKCTSLTKKQVIEKLLTSTDTYLSSKECIEYGICDEIKKLKT